MKRYSVTVGNTTPRKGHRHDCAHVAIEFVVIAMSAEKARERVLEFCAGRPDLRLFPAPTSRRTTEPSDRAEAHALPFGIVQANALFRADMMHSAPVRELPDVRPRCARLYPHPTDPDASRQCDRDQGHGGNCFPLS
jgi:hypothetical protein